MTRWMSLLFACGLVVACATGLRAGTTVEITVYDSGKPLLDGYSTGPGAIDTTSFIGLYGALNGQSAYYITKFDLSMLPQGTTAALVSTATLEVPQYDVLWNGSPWSLNMYLRGFTTTDNTQCVAADRDGVDYDYGIIRPVEPGRTGTSRQAFVDVTAQLKADLTAGHALSSYRYGPRPEDAVGRVNDTATFGTAEDVTWPNWYQFMGDNGKKNWFRLDVEIVPEPATICLFAGAVLGIVGRRRRVPV